MITILFDVETTGLLMPSEAKLDSQPRIIELGAIRIENGKKVDELSQIIFPQQDITAEITKITGIKNDELKGKPTFREFLPTLRKFFTGAKVLIAHNCVFDSTMLENELKMAGCTDFPLPSLQICSVQEYLPMFGYRPKLTELYEAILGFPLQQTHRALDDVEALYAILKKDNFFQQAGVM